LPALAEKGQAVLVLELELVPVLGLVVWAAQVEMAAMEAQEGMELELELVQAQVWQDNLYSTNKTSRDLYCNVPQDLRKSHKNSRHPICSSSMLGPPLLSKEHTKQDMPTDRNA
jgi:hypothetical protein